MQVIGKDGTIKTVSTEVGKKLIDSGFFRAYRRQPSVPLAQPTTELHTGLTYDPDAPYGERYKPTTTVTPGVTSESIHRGTSTVSPQAPPQQRVGWEPEAGPWRLPGLTTAEQSQVNSFWNDMNEYADGARWWNVQYGSTPDESGNYPRAQVRTRMGTMNLENSVEGLGWSDAMVAAITQRYAESDTYLPDGQVAQPDLFGDQPGGGGGGGGGGASGPTYIGPMRSVVEDTVKSMLTSLTGSENESLVQSLSDVYEKAHKAQWDVRRSGGTDIDPNQTVLDAIRGQEDYKRIHKLRPESQSETKWIADRVSRLTQLGVSAQDADDRAVWLAQTGTNLNDVDVGKFQMTQGRKDISLFNKIGKAAEQVARQL